MLHERHESVDKTFGQSVDFVEHDDAIRTPLDLVSNAANEIGFVFVERLVIDKMVARVNKVKVALFKIFRIKSVFSLIN